MKEGSLKKQLQAFIIEFKKISGLEPSRKTTNWLDAFDELRMMLEKRASQEKVILFFDELPWFENRRSEFLLALDVFWNRYWSDDPRVILIVNGSDSSWMMKNIIRNKGGFHGRLTAQIPLILKY